MSARLIRTVSGGQEARIFGWLQTLHPVGLRYANSRELGPRRDFGVVRSASGYVDRGAAYRF